MKLVYSFLFCGILLICGSLSASAQKLTKKFSAGFGLEAGLPTGDVKDYYNFAGGLTVRFAYQAGPGFATLTTGGIAFIPKDFEGEDPKAGILIPVKAGYKYVIGDHFFIMGEVGYSSFKAYSTDENDELVSVTNGGFTFAPGIGAQFGVFEVGIRYESAKIEETNLSYLGLRLGLNF